MAGRIKVFIQAEKNMVYAFSKQKQKKNEEKKRKSISSICHHFSVVLCSFSITFLNRIVCVNLFAIVVVYLFDCLTRWLNERRWHTSITSIKLSPSSSISLAPGIMNVWNSCCHFTVNASVSFSFLFLVCLSVSVCVCSSSQTMQMICILNYSDIYSLLIWSVVLLLILSVLPFGRWVDNVIFKTIYHRRKNGNRTKYIYINTSLFCCCCFVLLMRWLVLGKEQKKDVEN